MGFEPVFALPTLRAMAESMNLPERYLTYMWSSQLPHATIVASLQYYLRYTDEGAHVFGEFIKPNDWYLPFALVWFALATAAAKALARWASPVSFPPAPLANRAQAALVALAPEWGP